MRPSLHRHALAPLVALAALAVILLPSRSSAETYRLGGHEIEVTLRPVRASFMVGEPVDIFVTFVSDSDASLELLLSGEGARGDYEVRVTGPDGEPVPRPEGTTPESDTHISLGARRDDPTASGSVTYTMTLRGWARIDKPGVYKVGLRRGVTAGHYGEKGPESARAELRLETEFRVVEGGARLAGLIEEKRADLLTCDSNSALSALSYLARLEDNRVVGPLAEAAAKCKRPGVRYGALYALGQFPSDAAVEALRPFASDPDKDLRAVLASALMLGKRPEGEALLLSMRHDPYHVVRAVVLQALEAKDTEAARRVISEMTKDEHPAVREKALSLLRRRHAPPRP